LVVSEGDLWREHRRFALTTLKAAGMGKAWLGDSLLVEVTEFVKWLAISGGMPINPRHQLTQSVSNVICALVFGKRFQLGNETFNKLCNNIGENLQLMSELQSTKSFPILKYIPLGKYYKARKTLLQKIKENQLFIQSLIKEHQEEFISGTEGSQDFIISFLREREKQANNQNSTFDGKYTSIGIKDYFATF
jgi:Cytochrome P450